MNIVRSKIEIKGIKFFERDAEYQVKLELTFDDSEVDSSHTVTMTVAFKGTTDMAVRDVEAKSIETAKLLLDPNLVFGNALVDQVK